MTRSCRRCERKLPRGNATRLCYEHWSEARREDDCKQALQRALNSLVRAVRLEHSLIKAFARSGVLVRGKCGWLLPGHPRHLSLVCSAREGRILVNARRVVVVEGTRMVPWPED